MGPFTRIPLDEAHPIPPKKLNGIEITNAQGQLITRNVNALIIQLGKSGDIPIISLTIGGKIANANAP